MQRKIKFGIAGIGNIGIRHADNIQKNQRAELVAVFDSMKDRVDGIAKKYNCKAVYGYSDLLKEDIDVVTICTPSGAHAQMVIEALKKGRHVLCEKPMALNLADADKIIKAENKSSGKFFLVKQNRYNTPIRALKDAVYNNKLGKVTLINCNVLWNRGKEYYTQADWRGTMALDGGALITQCSHFLDLMIWIGGKVKSVYARMANLTHPYIETEDAGFITINFENGCIGSLQYTNNVYKHNLEGTMTVLGSKGTIKVGGEYLNVMEKWDVENVPKPESEESDGKYISSKSKHDKVIENVVSVLLDGELIATNSFQGRDSLEVMQAAYISTLKKKEIILPLTGRDYSFRLDKQMPISGNVKVK